MMQGKNILMIINQAIAFHSAKFLGKSTPVEAQIVGKLLTIEWDFDAVTALKFCLIGEIREQSSTDLFG